MTTFAKGKHPDHPAFTDETLVLEEKALYQGRWNREVDKHGDHVYELWQGGVKVASGDVEVLATISQHSTCGIQDDYEFWSANDCQPFAGKPVWILADKTEQHIFFDDNIHNLENDSIISARRETSDGNFVTLTGKEILQEQGFHLIRCPTIEPILCSDWYLTKVDEAQLNFRLRVSQNED